MQLLLCAVQDDIRFVFDSCNHNNANKLRFVKFYVVCNAHLLSPCLYFKCLVPVPIQRGNHSKGQTSDIKKVDLSL